MGEVYEKFYSPEQLDWLKQRAEEIGEERIREVENEWPRLIAEVRAEMQSGNDPSSDRMKELSDRWNSLVAEFTGGDPGIERSLASMYHAEPTCANRPKGIDLDADVFSFVRQANSGEDGITCPDRTTP